MRKDFEQWEDDKAYDDYEGSYVQDFLGWNDQDIDDVFEGDPDLYWNID